MEVSYLVLKSDVILAVGAHADDIELGLGNGVYEKILSKLSSDNEIIADLPLSLIEKEPHEVT
jgi:hypothetical protein